MEEELACEDSHQAVPDLHDANGDHCMHFHCTPVMAEAHHCQTVHDDSQDSLLSETENHHSMLYCYSCLTSIDTGWPQGRWLI